MVRITTTRIVSAVVGSTSHCTTAVTGIALTISISRRRGCARRRHNPAPKDLPRAPNLDCLEWGPGVPQEQLARIATALPPLLALSSRGATLAPPARGRRAFRAAAHSGGGGAAATIRHHRSTTTHTAAIRVTRRRARAWICR
jgi:hypothetical protein